MDERDAKSGGDVLASTYVQGAPGRDPVFTEKEFYSTKYNMKHTLRGKAVIINNKTFEPKTGMALRTGTDNDEQAMKTTLKALKFEEPKVHKDLKINQMKTVMENAANEDHTERDCFICVILTHGEEGFVYGIDGKIAIDDLVAPFKGDKCKSLAGKPKIFIVQACSDKNLYECDGDFTESDDSVRRRIPTEADFLMAYSIVPGSFAWCNPDDCSWFIQAIQNVFNQSWQKMDILTLMTRVIKKVAYDFESKKSKEYFNSRKQIPCITSMLTKDLYFNDE